MGKYVIVSIPEIDYSKIPPNMCFERCADRLECQSGDWPSVCIHNGTWTPIGKDGKVET